MKPILPKLIPALLALISLNAAAVTRYVDLNSPSPAPPYTSWPTAATNIQDAIDAAVAGDLVLVTNGVYQVGGRVVFGSMTNRVAVTKPLHLRSVNGPSLTVIKGIPFSGDNSIRCVYLTNGASLTGFTLTNGSTRGGGDVVRENAGGGVWCESTTSVLSNCFVFGNSAYYLGGGAYSGTLYSCIIAGNTTQSGGGANSSTLIGCLITNNAAGFGGGGGGGADSCILSNCVITSNSGGGRGGGVKSSVVHSSILSSNRSSSFGGGAYESTLASCVIYSNRASEYGGGAYVSSLTNCTVVGNGRGVDYCTVYNSIIYSNMDNNAYSSDLNYCDTLPLPNDGVGNITSNPAFLSFESGSFHLSSTSACINAGNNAYTASLTDLDGNPRITGGTVDIGAYEFQSPSSVLSYAWAQQNGFPTDSSADFTDADSDGMNNYGEWRSDTIPTNTLSVLKMVNATNSPTGAKVTWQSVPTRNYWLERATNLGVASPFQSIATNIAGVAGTKTFTDSSATNSAHYFYRVGVH